ncbi:MAG: transaldolase [Fimbriimonadaceae bacterium]
MPSPLSAGRSQKVALRGRSPAIPLATIPDVTFPQKAAQLLKTFSIRQFNPPSAPNPNIQTDKIEPPKAMNPIQKLPQFGQSPWLDFIRRNYIKDGELQQMIDLGIRGVTSNPAIFEKAIAGSNDYDEAIISLTGAAKTPEEILDILSIEDVAMAADLFRPIFDQTEGLDGYVSLEVSPHLADDVQGTVADGLRLWKELNRPNVMIKVPATEAGVKAFRELTAAGVNVNVTLLFSTVRYQAIAEAYIEALEERHAKGLPLHMASVASFFVSRVDTLLDPELAEKSPELVGKIAIANSHMAYKIYEDLFKTDRFQKLVDAGAKPQRLLWASTSAKNPAYSPVLYVETLIGPDTVNTMPIETIDAYLEMGEPADTLTGQYRIQKSHMDAFAVAGFDIEATADTLQQQAIDKFVEPYEKLLTSLKKKQDSIYVG